jgi:drug/metabolite transporter (DMT)-like permease
MSSLIKNKPLFYGYLFAFGATAIWSGNFIIARVLNNSMSPISIAFWRWVVAVLVLFPFAIKGLIKDWHILKKNKLYLSITALLGVTVFNTLIYLASHTTTAINLSLISITFPIFIIIFSRLFLKETITLNKAIGIVLVVFGVIYLITKGKLDVLLNISFAVGDIWTLLAAILFAIYSLLLKQKPEALGILSFQLSTFLLGLLFLFPFFIWESSVTPSVIIEPKLVLSILYIGIFASLSAYILWNKAVINLGATNASMIYYTLPLFSGFLAFVILKEPIGWTHLLSLILIVSGILAATYKKSKLF